MIRSKVTQIDEYEKPTIYFCSLEAKHYINKTICKIEKENGKIITDQQEILNEVELFYKHLYDNHSELLEDVDLNEILNEEHYKIMIDRNVP